MDTPVSHKDEDLKEVIGLFLQIEKSNLSKTGTQNNKVIKYTKLPEFDIQNKEIYKTGKQPSKMLRLISLDSPATKSSRSMNPLYYEDRKVKTNKITRKVVSITEDANINLHSKTLHDNKQHTVKIINSPVEMKKRDPKPQAKLPMKNMAKQSLRTTSQLISSVKPVKENKPCAKSLPQEVKKLNPRPIYRNKRNFVENNKYGNFKEKEVPAHYRSAVSKTSVSKNYSTNKSEKLLFEMKKRLNDDLMIENRFFKKNPVILVPLENSKSSIETVSSERVSSNAHVHRDLDLLSEPTDQTEEVVEFQDFNHGSAPMPTVDQATCTDTKSQIIYKYIEQADVQTQVVKEFENLNIPNVTLIKDKNDSRPASESHNILPLHSTSLPNLRIPAFKVTPTKNDYQSNSIVISRATVTYTTKQKINFEVVGSNENPYNSNQSPSPLMYPMNVVSVLKKEIESNDLKKTNMNKETKEKSNKELSRIKELKSLDCPYAFSDNKLMKPSDIISTIRVNNGLLRSDYFCEQFERELNFIDSFFESLQYLDNCSYTDHCIDKTNIDTLVQNPSLLDPNFDVKISEYDDLLTSLENGGATGDMETMASKNLFLLNILIRNEQRRAKNLLFVLKRREDALKDFTKSQILYLENKKKKDNTDISALKKKQRGALLKLQHECGEMQRMRKALLTLSEKRKVALLKTKRDLELKLKNNVDVDQIILSKKKVKRNTSLDRSTPLKCFDLSSSGCEDSTTSRHTAEAVLAPPELNIKSVSSSEKCIQTGDSILTSPVKVDSATDTISEDFVVVDGGYLNILFHNLSLPEIFSRGKQYEVKEEALRNIVNSTNSVPNGGTPSIERLMEQIKNRDFDRCSTPSTARSLLDEFDQYYRFLKEEERIGAQDRNCVLEISNANVQTSVSVTSRSVNTCASASCVEEHVSCDVESKREQSIDCPTGPLPVPAGAAAVPETIVVDVPSAPPPSVTITDSSASSDIRFDLTSSTSSIAPGHCEAEELRRQQLAIEKEIKELEQQQCRLLVVREIPDKPPPPYTPPVETKADSRPRKFHIDNTSLEKIHEYMTDTMAQPDVTDSFDMFVHDYCHETLAKQQQEESDKPWDACNLLPPRPPVNNRQLVAQASQDINEILSGVAPTMLAGVSSRRSDHIDDILFSEWRRLEKDWTSIHTGEDIVKNQIFECIFQKILSETVDEYKKQVAIKT